MAETPVDAAARRLGSLARHDVALGPLTTYRVGGPASLFAEVADEASLAKVASAVVASGVDVIVVGNGSNLLVADEGFEGLAVKLGAGFDGVTIDDTTVIAGGGALLPVVARRTVGAGLTGFEWAVGVPGTIGGAVRMNAGGHGSDMRACLVEVRVLDLRSGDHGVVSAADLALSYRSSALAPTSVVLDATLALRRGDRAAGEAELAEIVRWRRENQPGGANAGSVFVNPPGDSAGRLIDEAGARGLRLGTAEVSPKHANFIQADEGGNAADVVALMGEVRRRVAAATGVALRPETRLVGFPPEVVAAAGATGPESAR